MKLNYKIILLLSIITLNLNSVAQQQFKLCDKDDPFTELDWIVNYPGDDVVFTSLELNGEIYIKASDKGYYTCDGALFCETNNQHPTDCDFDFLENGYRISSSSLPPCEEEDYDLQHCPIISSICSGETLILNMNRIGAIKPLPTIVYEDICCAPDWSRGVYNFTDTQGDVINGYSINVSPEKTTLYKASWTYFGEVEDIGGAPKRAQDSGIGYFLVIVEDCSGSTDVFPDFHRPEKVDFEGIHTVTSYWENGGPAFFEGVDFIWEVNGEIDTTYSWIKGRTIYGRSNVSNDGLYFSTHHRIYFETNKEYHIKVTAVNPNGLPDLNTENNVYEFTIPAFEAKYDLKLLESYQPFNTETGEIKIDIESKENGFVKNFAIRWSVDGVEQQPYKVEDMNWDKDRTFLLNRSTFTIGTINLNDIQDHEIKVWLELPENITDVEPKDNKLNYYYSASNKSYYDADVIITICSGSYANLKTPLQNNYRNGCIWCYDTVDPLFVGPGAWPEVVYHWTLNGEIISTNNSAQVNPSESTIYKLNAKERTHCWDTCLNNSVGPDTSQSKELTYSVVVIDCTFKNNPWLKEVVDESNCNSESISFFENGFTYIKSTEEGILYYGDGTFYCEDAPNYSCTEVYNLDEPINTWTCSEIL